MSYVKDKQSIKLVVTGDGATGKTCLLLSYANNRFPTGYVPTVFDNYVVSITAGDKEIELSLWDTAGQEEYNNLRPLSYSKADVFLLCFSTVNPISFENISSAWYREITHFCPEVPFVLVGTKSDLKNDEATLKELKAKGRSSPISAEQGQQLAQKLGAVQYVECSAYQGKNLKRVFDEAVKAVILQKGRGRKASRKSRTCVLF